MTQTPKYPGNIRRLRPRGMGALSGDSSAQATSTSKANVPVTTQVTTAVSPIFNVSSGGGTVSQSGSTSQTATPTSRNVMTDITGQPTQGGGYGSGGSTANDSAGSSYDPTAPGYVDPYTTPASYTDEEYSGYPAEYTVQPQSGGINKNFIYLGIAAAAVYFLLFAPKKNGKK